MLVWFSASAQESVTVKSPLSGSVGLNSTGSDIVISPLLQANPDIVQSSGYYTLNSGSVNIGTGTTFYCLSLAHRTRIRQSGSITRISFYLPSKPAALTSFYFQLWRKNGSNYDLIGQENILSSMVAATDNNITLSTPIDALESDYVGYGYTVSSDPGNFLNGVTLASSGRYVNSVPTSSGYNWSSGTSLGQYWPINTYMRAPVIVGIGDSRMAGHTGHDSYIEQSVSPDNPAFGVVYKIGQRLNVTTQNMGIGSQGTNSIQPRFAADVVAAKPRYAIIEGGINDIVAGTANATIISRFTSMINAAVAANIIPIVSLNQPWTTGTTLQMQQMDDLNDDLTALAATYPTAILVNATGELGEFRVGGDAGNKWNMKAIYDVGDGGHYNSAGNSVYADSIIAAILQTSGNIFRVDGNQYVYGDIEASDKVTTDTLTATGPASLGSTTISTIANASTDLDKFLVSDGGIIKYRTGTQLLSDIGAQAGWGLNGNAGITEATDFIGTTDNKALIFKTNGTERGRIGGNSVKWIIGTTADNGVSAFLQTGTIIPNTSAASNIGASTLYYATTFTNAIDASGTMNFTSAGTGIMRMRGSSNAGLYIGGGVNNTAILHLAAGTVSASRAPLKFTSGAASQTTKEAGAVNYDGTNLTLSDATYAYTLAKFLTATATLDFASTGSGAVADLTVTVTGAAVGDVVTIGVPNGSITATGSWFAWVSATDTVTVRYSPKATEDPASGSYKLNVFKQ